MKFPLKCLDEADRVKEAFCFSGDLVRLDFEVCGLHAAIFYIDGLVNVQLLETDIIKPLKSAKGEPPKCADDINKLTFSADYIREFEQFDEFIKDVASADVGFIIDGAKEYYAFSLKAYQTRGISEPPSSSVLRGPREGFTEDMKTNLTMLRRRLRTPKFVCETLSVGQYSNTAVSVCHLNGVATPSVVEEITTKITAITIDGIIDSAYIARHLEGRKGSIYRQVGISEKSDAVAAKMLEGRVAIVVDGSPIVLTLPYVLLEDFQSPEDYYVKSMRGSFTRLLRIIVQLVAILMPGLYVAVQEFQYDILPMRLMTLILNGMFNLPFSPTIEMLVVIVFFEIISEASVKMPRHISMSISTVGAIVLGDAAVQAGLLSAPTVLVMAISSLGIYCSPEAADSAGILRLAFVLLAGAMGVFGIACGALFLIAYLVGMSGYGTSMMAPLAPMLSKDFKDTILIGDRSEMKTRPGSIPNVNKTRNKEEGEEE